MKINLRERLGFGLIFCFFLVVQSFILNESFCAEKKKAASSDHSETKSFMPTKFYVNFEQSFLSSLTGKEKKSEGIIKYFFPGHLWLEVLKPEKDRTLFISDSKKSWYYTPSFDGEEKGEVVVQPANKLLLSNFFDALKNGLQPNELYEIKKGKEKIELLFNKKPSNEIGIQRSVLFFDKKNSVPQLKDLQSMTLYYTDGRIVTLKFGGFREDAGLQKEDFAFKVWDKVKVIDRQ